MDYRVGKFPFRGSGRAVANYDYDGMVEFVADAKTDCILGAHILQHAALELIAEAASVMEFGGSSEDLGRTCHSHPTLSEAVKEAAFSRREACPSHRQPIRERPVARRVADLRSLGSDEPPARDEA